MCADGAGPAGFGQILFGTWWRRRTLALTKEHDINKRTYSNGDYSPCSITEGFLAVLSTHSSTAAAAPRCCVWTEGWGLARWQPVRAAEWMAVCRLEQESSLSELLKPSFWDCTLQKGRFILSYSNVRLLRSADDCDSIIKIR